MAMMPHSCRVFNELYFINLEGDEIVLWPRDYFKNVGPNAQRLFEEASTLKKLFSLL